MGLAAAAKAYSDFETPRESLLKYGVEFQDMLEMVADGLDIGYIRVPELERPVQQHGFNPHQKHYWIRIGNILLDTGILELEPFGTPASAGECWCAR